MPPIFVELLYFSGCPHVETARENLRAALEQTRRPHHWSERELEAGGGEAAYPSPTILIDGEDVAPVPPNTADACRLQGAPLVADIVLALAAAG